MASAQTTVSLPLNRGELDLTPRELIILGKELKNEGGWRFTALPPEEYTYKVKPPPKNRPIYAQQSSSGDSLLLTSIEQSHPLYELIKDSYAKLSKSQSWIKKVHKILTVLCTNSNARGIMTKLSPDDPSFNEISAKVLPLKYVSLQDVLEKLAASTYETSTDALSDIYCVLICAFRISSPGSEEWLKIHRIASLVSNLVISENLNDNYVIKKDRPPTSYLNNGKRAYVNDYAKAPKPKAPAYQREYKSKSEIEFEQELIRIAANKKPKPQPKNTVTAATAPITYEERMEFQDLLAKLPEEVHLELFTTFEKTATWKNVDDEIELDDQATDPLVFRSLIQWAKDKQRSAI